MRCPEICVFCLRNNSIEKICFSFRHEFIRISSRKHVDDESPEKRHFTIVKSGNFADHGLWFCASHIPAASTSTSTSTADKWMLDGYVLYLYSSLILTMSEPDSPPPSEMSEESLLSLLASTIATLTSGPRQPPLRSAASHQAAVTSSTHVGTTWKSGAFFAMLGAFRFF